MSPDPRLAFEVGPLKFRSRTAISANLDPEGRALPAFRRFGVAVVEVGPVGISKKNGPVTWTRHVDGWTMPAGQIDPARLESRLSSKDDRDAQVWLKLEACASLSKLDSLLGELGGRIAGITISGWENADLAAKESCGRFTKRHRLPWLVNLPSDTPPDSSASRVREAISQGAAGAWLRSDRNQPDGTVRVTARNSAETSVLLTRLRQEFGRDAFLVAGGCANVKDALALREAGADLVSLEVGLVFSGPGLPKRVNEAFAHSMPTQPKKEAPPVASMAWSWGLLLGAAMVIGGLLALAVASTKVVLPYDEAFCGMDRSQLNALNPRLLAFMSHDRVSLAGTMLSTGMLYAGLAWHGIRLGHHWAKVATAVSSLSGFFSFFLFLGFGYFDPFHAFVTAILFQFLLLLIHSPVAEPAAPSWPEIDEGRAWRAGLWGQLLFVSMGIGLIVAGVFISTIGVGPVFVREDLEFLSTTRETLQSAGPRLVPLIAHDRASLGGMLIASGLGVWLSAQWGFRAGQRWLWWTLALAGAPAFAAAIGIHIAVGYTHPLHLAPAVFGAIWFAVALWLTRAWLCEPESAILPAIGARAVGP